MNRDKVDTLYHVGDRVVVRPDLRSYWCYYDNGVGEIATPSMVLLAGKAVTISGMVCGSYYVFEDEYKFRWSGGMFVGLAEDDEKYDACFGDHPPITALYSIE